MNMNIDVYRGGDDWWGFTPVGVGSDILPADKRPWRPHPTQWWISKDHPARRLAADDLEIIAGIEKQGYYACRLDPERTEQMLRILKGE